MLGTQFFFGCRLLGALFCFGLPAARSWEPISCFGRPGTRLLGALKDFPIDPLCGAALALDIVGCGLSHLLLLGKCFV